MSKRIIKISPSLLDQFRVCRDGDFGKDVQDLIDAITKPFEINEAMSRGRAYHRMLEESPEKFLSKDTFSVYEPDLNRTWIFSKEAVDPIFKVRQTYLQMLHEVKNSLILDFPGFEVVMNMRHDGLDGFYINEFKTTGGQVSYDRYYESFQWRCYLAGLPEARAVIYRVFKLNDKNTWCDYTTYIMYREGNEMQIVKNEVSALLDWLKMNPELLDYIESKGVVW